MARLEARTSRPVAHGTDLRQLGELGRCPGGLDPMLLTQLSLATVEEIGERARLTLGSNSCRRKAIGSESRGHVRFRGSTGARSVRRGRDAWREAARRFQATPASPRRNVVRNGRRRSGRNSAAASSGRIPRCRRSRRGGSRCPTRTPACAKPASMPSATRSLKQMAASMLGMELREVERHVAPEGAGRTPMERDRLKPRLGHHREIAGHAFGRDRAVRAGRRRRRCDGRRGRSDARVASRPPVA